MPTPNRITRGASTPVALRHAGPSLVVMTRIEFEFVTLNVSIFGSIIPRVAAGFFA